MSIINNKKAAVYVRVSNDEPEDGTSLDNQVDIITNYCNEHKLIVKKVYSDNGYTGANFDRPAFKEMIGDIEAGIIDTVVVKDLSRFGRNIIKAGEYIDEYFVANQIRFISVNDDYDSANTTNIDESITIKMFLHDYYLKECSRKRLAAYTQIENTGNFSLGGIYGYLRVNKKLVIDETTAPIVRLIFQDFVNGKTPTEIANYLNENNIPTPFAARRLKGFIFHGPTRPTHYIWDRNKVGNILLNIEYTGTQINYKSFKKPMTRARATVKRDPIYIENEHEAIISKELFAKAEEIRNQRNCFKNKKHSYIDPNAERLNRFLYCPVCGKAYVFNADKYGNTYRDKKCGISIRSELVHKGLHQRVLDKLSLLNIDSNIFKREVLKKYDIKPYEERIAEINDERKSVDSAIEQLFENYAMGEISEDEYNIEGKILSDHLELVELKENDLKRDRYKEEQAKSNASKFLMEIANADIKKLTRIEIIKLLIDKVYLTRDGEGIVFTEIQYKCL